MFIIISSPTLALFLFFLFFASAFETSVLAPRRLLLCCRCCIYIFGKERHPRSRPARAQQRSHYCLYEWVHKTRVAGLARLCAKHCTDARKAKPRHRQPASTAPRVLSLGLNWRFFLIYEITAEFCWLRDKGDGRSRICSRFSPRCPT